MANRTLLTSSAIAFMLAYGTATAQDTDVYYQTPTLKSGQPVAGAAVVTPVQLNTPVTPGASEPVTPATEADEAYLGTPQVQTSGDVRFVTGGIGAAEKGWFDNQKGYDLKVTYSDTTGHHLANVGVSLTNGAGTSVLDTTTTGPYLLVDTKPGTYTLKSDYNGQSNSRKVTLGKGLTRTSVTFKDVVNPDE